jgi:hypothetical protein
MVTREMTDNAKNKRKTTDKQRIVYKILHIKLMIDQYCKSASIVYISGHIYCKTILIII